jgi:hypothetical protein
MRKLYVIICIFCPFAISAQANCIFPEFVFGEIYYKETAISALINYNLFLSDILAVKKERKTRLTDIDRIEYVSMSNKRFIPLNDNTFGEILIDGGLTLAAKYSVSIVKENDDIKSISKMALNKLLDAGNPLPEGITFKIDSSYYFIRQRNEQAKFYLPGNNVTKATHAGIIKLFAKNKTEINSFVETNKTDFSSFESLRQLVNFCEKYTD